MNHLSAISVFDWKGPDFLWFYGIAFCFALAWSLWRRHRANEKFNLPEAANFELTDPYEIAFLAGGAPRCAQVAVVRLIKADAIGWKRTKILGEWRLVGKGEAMPDFNGVERALFSSILGYGKKGMPVSSVSQLVATSLGATEAKLATLGLRPTSSEEGSRGCFIIFPMLILILIGIVKLCIGISRDKPVWFLVGFLFLTVIAGAIIASARKPLTPAGEQLLKKMRGNPSANPTQDATLFGIALLGISGIGHDESLAGVDALLQKEISRMGPTGSSSDGGSGCSSGCGSGCGGGCGGCGGD